jgi:hypothetical protein
MEGYTFSTLEPSRSFAAQSQLTGLLWHYANNKSITQNVQQNIPYLALNKRKGLHIKHQLIELHGRV